MPAGLSLALSLSLVWVDVHGAAAPVRAEAMAETASILGAAGLDVEWRTSDGGERAPQADEIQVVLLDSPPGTLGPDVMGSAPPTARGPRAVWVFLSGVRATLGFDPGGSRALRPAEIESLGRAAGRVIVHEIVHVTAPDRPHSEAGLMAPRLGRAVLVQPRLELETALRDVLHTAARRTASASKRGGLQAVLGERER